MTDNNKMNQGQNDQTKKPGMGTEKVSNPGTGNQDQAKNLNKTPGQNQKIDQDADIGTRQTSSQKPGQGNMQNPDDKATPRQARPDLDGDKQK